MSTLWGNDSSIPIDLCPEGCKKSRFLCEISQLFSRYGPNEICQWARYDPYLGIQRFLLYSLTYSVIHFILSIILYADKHLTSSWMTLKSGASCLKSICVVGLKTFKDHYSVCPVVSISVNLS